MTNLICLYSMTRYIVTAEIYDRKGRRLAKGRNSYTQTHPVQAMYAKKAGQPNRVFLHAEIDALIRVRGGKPYKISIKRKNAKTGRVGLAKPCPVCELAIKRAGIKQVEYTL